MATTQLPRICARLREELGLEEAKTLPLINAACDVIGLEKCGTLVERARACMESLGISDADLADTATLAEASRAAPPTGEPPLSSPPAVPAAIPKAPPGFKPALRPTAVRVTACRRVASAATHADAGE